MNDSRWAGIAAHGLPGATVRPPTGPFDDTELAELADRAGRRRLGGLLLAAAEAGAIAVTDQQYADLLDRRCAAVAVELRLEQALVETAVLLDGVGVPIRVLKGPAAAHLDYADPGLRSYADVDVLVRVRDLDIALGALLAAGHARRFPELRPGFDRRFAKGVCVVRRDGFEIDVHRTLVGGVYGLAIDLFELWAESEAFTVAGRRLDALGTTNRFLHAALHATLGSRVPPLHTLRDLSQLACVVGVDLDALDHRVSAWGAAPVVRQAVGAAWTTFGLPREHPVARWASGLATTDADRRTMAAYRRTGERFAATSLAALGRVPGWADRARFAWALAFPSRSYLRAQGSDRRSRLRRALGVVRRPH